MAQKYKVGDKVRIKSLDWYNENKDELGNVGYFSYNMKQFCGQIVTISKVCPPFYCMENIDIFLWTDEMIEGLVTEEVDLIPKFGEYSDNDPLDVPTMTTEFVKEHGFPCPDGYIFKDENGNVINAQKIVLEKKKKEYPKTYCECKDILGLWDIDDTERGYYKTDLIDKFQMLLICRDAYWKIAGEEMGLGKPWEPDWKNGEQNKFCIYNYKGNIKSDSWCFANAVLSFPTEEMRDAFYEAFKEYIETCKELL